MLPAILLHTQGQTHLLAHRILAKGVRSASVTVMPTSLLKGLPAGSSVASGGELLLALLLLLLLLLLPLVQLRLSLRGLRTG